MDVFPKIGATTHFTGSSRTVNRCSVVWILIQGGRSRKKHSPLGRLVEGEWRVSGGGWRVGARLLGGF